MSPLDGQSLSVSSSLTWSSLPRDVQHAQSQLNPFSTERTGDTSHIGGEINDYRVEDRTIIGQSTPAAAKSIVATSVLETAITATKTHQSGIEQVAIGEIIRYRLSAQIPEGTNSVFELIDQLPEGLTYLSDGTQRIAFVADQSGFGSGVLEGDELVKLGADGTVTPTFALPEEVVAYDTVSHRMSIRLGEIINQDQDLNAEFVIVEFNALVLNSTQNSRGQELTNLFSVQAEQFVDPDSAQQGEEQSVPLREMAEPIVAQVVEPNVTLQSRLLTTPTNIDGLARYEITLENASDETSSVAYNLVISQILDSPLSLVHVGASNETVTIIDTTIDAKVETTETPVPANRTMNPQWTASIDRLIPGERISFLIDATATKAAPAIAANAKLLYHSVSDNHLDSPTDRLPQDLSEEAILTESFGRRYEVRASNIFPLHAITPVPTQPGSVKVQMRDQLFADLNGDGLPSLGDTVRYVVTVVNPSRHRANDLELYSQIDPVLQLIPASVTLIDSQNRFSGSNPAQITGLRLGNLEPSHTISLTFDALVSDALIAGTRMLSAQTVAHVAQHGFIVSDDPDTLAPFDETMTLLAQMPLLYAARIVNSVENLDQGDRIGLNQITDADVVEYRTIVENHGNMPATEVVLTDLLDPNLILMPDSLSANQNGVQHAGKSAINAASFSQDDTSENSLNFSFGDLQPGMQAEVTIQASIRNPLLGNVRHVSDQGMISSNELPPILTDDPTTRASNDSTRKLLSPTPRLVATMIDHLILDLDGNGFPSPGDILGYQIILQNVGSRDANNLVYTNPLDTSTILIPDSVVSSNGSVTSPNTADAQSVEVKCTTLAVGKSVTISYRVQIRENLEETVETIITQGIVTTAESISIPTDDPKLFGDANPTLTVLASRPYIQMTLQDILISDSGNDRLFSTNDRLLYLIHIINAGNTPAAELFLEHEPDINSSLRTGSVQTGQGRVIVGNTAENRTVSVDIGLLPARFAQTSIAFEVGLEQDAKVGQIASQALLTYSEHSNISERTQHQIQSDDPDTQQPIDPTMTRIYRAPTVTDPIPEPAQEKTTKTFLPFITKR
ncbi:DUF11 domain-containing protein [Chloroflexi bacterium TSY]|nr:DUF11 domain-containing protein [Chloroflexi bacterium TSY]